MKSNHFTETRIYFNSEKEWVWAIILKGYTSKKKTAGSREKKQLKKRRQWCTTTGHSREGRGNAKVNTKPKTHWEGTHRNYTRAATSQLQLYTSDHQQDMHPPGQDDACKSTQTRARCKFYRATHTHTHKITSQVHTEGSILSMHSGYILALSKSMSGWHFTMSGGTGQQATLTSATSMITHPSYAPSAIRCTSTTTNEPLSGSWQSEANNQQGIDCTSQTKPIARHVWITKATRRHKHKTTDAIHGRSSFPCIQAKPLLWTKTISGLHLLMGPASKLCCPLQRKGGATESISHMQTSILGGNRCGSKHWKT